MLLWAAAACIALYALLAHLLLCTPLLRSLLGRRPNKLLFEYGSAWSPWPGRVVLRNVHVRVRGKKVDFYLTLDRADLRLDLWSLVRRRFHVEKLRGEGMALRVRMRPDPQNAEAMKEAQREDWPTIPGLPDPAQDPPGEPETPEDRRWTLAFEDFGAKDYPIDISSLRELWIAQYRYSGEARVRGSFRLHPGREFQMGPSVVDVQRGTFTIGRREAALDVQGTLACQVDAYNPKLVQKADILRYFSFGVRLDTRHEGLSFVEEYVPEAAKLHFSGGWGETHGDARVDHGVLQVGSWFRYVAHAVTLHHPTVSVQSDQAGEVRVEARAEGATAHGTTVLSNLVVRRRWAESYPITAPRIDLVARSTALDLSREPLHDLLVSADAPATEVSDLRILEPIVQGRGKVHFGAGKATLRAHADYSVPAKRIAGRARLESPRGTFKVDDIEITSKLVTDVEEVHMTLSPPVLRFPHATLEASEVDVHVRGDDERAPPPWWLRARIENGELRFVPKPTLSAAIDATMRDGRPILYVYATQKDWPGWTRDLIHLEGLRTSAKITVGPSLIDISDVRAAGGPFELGARYRQEGEHRRGRLRVGAGALALGVDVRDGESSWKPEVGRDWVQVGSEDD